MELRLELADVKKDIQYIKENSDERLAAIMARFDRIDTRWAWLVSSVFAVCLTFGGIYLEAYFNKDSVPKSTVALVDGV